MIIVGRIKIWCYKRAGKNKEGRCDFDRVL